MLSTLLALPLAFDRPTLAWFGLLSYPFACSLPDRLVDMEEMLSEGTLRESVHVTRLTASFYDAPGLDAKRVRMKELIRWVDSRPEIQRAYFYIQLATWSLATRLDQSVIDLSDEVIARVPDGFIDDECRENYRQKVNLRRDHFQQVKTEEHETEREVREE